MKTHDIAAAIAAVEKIYAEAEAAAPQPGRRPPHDPIDSKGWDHRQAAGRKAVQRLVEDHGARFSLSGAHEYRLTLAGVTTTCTSGEWGLMTNWLNAASRKLAKGG